MLCLSGFELCSRWVPLIQGEQQHSEGKRCQLNTEDVKRQQQHRTITLQTKPTKRGNTDCRRLRSIEFATKPTRNHREAYSQNYLPRCNDRHQKLHHLQNRHEEYLSNGMRTANQPFHRFTVSFILQ